MPECPTCPLRPRRTFLARVSALTVAWIAGAFAPATLDALPVVEAAGLIAGVDERRYPIPAADGVTIDQAAQAIVVRYQQRVYAFALSCPHQNTALRWRAADQRFQCPKHESKYKPDGTFISGRATRNMDRLPIRRDGDAVIVGIDGAWHSDTQAAQWTAAVVAL